MKNRLGFIVIQKNRSTQIVFSSLLEALLDAWSFKENNESTLLIKKADHRGFYSYLLDDRFSFPSSHDVKMKDLTVKVVECIEINEWNHHHHEMFDESKWRLTDVNAEKIISDILFSNGNIFLSLSKSTKLTLCSSIFVLIIYEMLHSMLKSSFLLFYFLKHFSDHSLYGTMKPCDNILDLNLLQRIFLDLNIGRMESIMKITLMEFQNTTFYCLCGEKFEFYFSLVHPHQLKNIQEIDHHVTCKISKEGVFFNDGNKFKWDKIDHAFLNIFSYFEDVGKSVIMHSKMFQGTNTSISVVPIIPQKNIMDLLFQNNNVSFDHCMNFMKSLSARDLAILEDYYTNGIPFYSESLSIDFLSILYYNRQKYEIFDNSVFKRDPSTLSYYSSIPSTVEKYKEATEHCNDQERFMKKSPFFYWLKSQCTVLFEEEECYTLHSLIGKEYIHCYTSLLDILPIYEYFVSLENNPPVAMEKHRIVCIKFIKGKQILLDFSFCDNPANVAAFWNSHFKYFHGRDEEDFYSLKHQIMRYLPFVSGYIGEGRKSFHYFPIEGSYNIKSIHLSAVHHHVSQMKKVKEFALKKSLIFREHKTTVPHVKMCYVASRPSLKMISVPFERMRDSLVSSFYLIHPKCSPNLIVAVINKIFGSQEIDKKNITIQTFQAPYNLNQVILIYPTAINVPSSEISATMRNVWHLKLMVYTSTPHYYLSLNPTKDSFFKWMMDSIIFVSHYIEGDKAELSKV